ncbi:MAG: nucleotide sugar dehydrogenase [Rhodospirillales bacterium]|nr:nucleotide sugar dehydrogenase [Rhodospirillales bacterium]MBT4039726.1 nucleotide sugar dehydrogenase [Rhodospirillales bacterium]MBT4626157.1 nucleotide sugar dehydrogenase [Rhodospirillales bacterium]MBT5350259.1 nucleotide sugar dehydrogenase [Rhodospirillales bacterium]MBT5522297.1 nucleotide sugar dehydrogenase [Rhodospirillales bacterium]
MSHNRLLSIIGLGYVGLPAAVSFARAGNHVVAFDINEQRIAELESGVDHTNEVTSEELASASLHLSHDKSDLQNADFHIVTVPTPIDENNQPDLSPLLSASHMIGSYLKKGDIVVYESTVYPGATEEECVPILESVSSLKLGEDFSVGYSPERINPGDKEHRFETITKVVSGSDERTLKIVADVYGSVITAGIHQAPTIRTAEAAKVIENTQRDLNIALMNELSIIFHKLGIDTRDVLAAAGTKWNFLPFVPGLVGGHCIGVDPYYLTHRAEKAGYIPEVILAGRRINDGMGSYLAAELVKLMTASGKAANQSVVSVLGVTFKEDVPDVRNSRIIDVIAALESYGVTVQSSDPVADTETVSRQMGLNIKPIDTLPPADAVILGVAHNDYISGGWPMVAARLTDGHGVVCDIKGALDRKTVPDGIQLWCL